MGVGTFNRWRLHLQSLTLMIGMLYLLLSSGQRKLFLLEPLLPIVAIF